jgi:hypothetical protein
MMVLRLTTARAAWFLGLGIAFQTIFCSITRYAADGLGHRRLLGLVDLFDLGRDSSIPTWWSSFMLLVSAVLLALIAGNKTERRAGDRFYWWLLAAIFCLFSVDEVAMIHEQILGSWGRSIQARTGLSSWFVTFSWLIVGVPLVLGFGVVFLRFFLRLPRRTQVYFGLGAAFLVGGGAVVEGFNGHTRLTTSQENPVLTIGTIIEECFEMTGVAIFICGLIDYLVRECQIHEVRLRIGDTIPAAPGSESEADRVVSVSRRSIETASHPGWQEQEIELAVRGSVS